MVGGRAGEHSRAPTDVCFRKEPEPLQTLPQSQRWHRCRFCRGLTFPEQKSGSGILRSLFLCIMQSLFSVENAFVNHHTQTGDVRVSVVGSQPTAGCSVAQWCLVWFHDESGLLCS